MVVILARHVPDGVVAQLDYSPTWLARYSLPGSLNSVLGSTDMHLVDWLLADNDQDRRTCMLKGCQFRWYGSLRVNTLASQDWLRGAAKLGMYRCLVETRAFLVDCIDEFGQLFDQPDMLPGKVEVLGCMVYRQGLDFATLLDRSNTAKWLAVLSRLEQSWLAKQYMRHIAAYLDCCAIYADWELDCVLPDLFAKVCKTSHTGQAGQAGQAGVDHQAAEQWLSALGLFGVKQAVERVLDWLDCQCDQHVQHVHRAWLDTQIMRFGHTKKNKTNKPNKTTKLVTHDDHPGHPGHPGWFVFDQHFTMRAAKWSGWLKNLTLQDQKTYRHKKPSIGWMAALDSMTIDFVVAYLLACQHLDGSQLVAEQHKLIRKLIRDNNSGNASWLLPMNLTYFGMHACIQQILAELSIDQTLASRQLHQRIRDQIDNANWTNNLLSNVPINQPNQPNHAIKPAQPCQPTKPTKPTQPAKRYPGYPNLTNRTGTNDFYSHVQHVEMLSK